MSAGALKFDEIGYWSELKLEILEKYGKAYTRAFKSAPDLVKNYIDAFSGPGVNISQSTGGEIEGSPLRALRIVPPFEKFHFIDLNPGKTDYLQRRCEGKKNVKIYTGDASKILLDTILPQVRYEDYQRALCLLDPYGLHLDWEVMRKAGRSGAVEIFLNFPVMDINRTVIWHEPDRVLPGNIERMNRFWGDGSWREVAYAQPKQPDFLLPEKQEKQTNEVIAAAFFKRLKKEAGFKFVPEPLPMRNSKGATVYYLFFASCNQTGNEIVTDIFNKYRSWP